MKKRVLVVFLFSVMLNSSCVEENRAEVNVISPEEMQSLLQTENVQLVDVRTPKEYTLGHIEYAQNIDYKSPTFSEDIKKLDKDKPVLLYCHKGGRSAKCAQKMVEAGFKKIYDLKGGFSKWRHKGLKIDTKS